MKSHDCHMSMQTLIPITSKDLLPKKVWDILIEISHLFIDIYSSKLNTHHMEQLETNIIDTICKFKMSFFSSSLTQ